MARKDDRRVQRTRKILRESLLELILDQGYDDVSIQDITQRANLGRATFYLHYKEKDELLQDSLHQISEGFLGSAAAPGALGSPLSNQKAVQRLFELATEHYDLFRIMTIGKGSVVATRQLMAMMRDVAGQALEEVQQDGGTPPLSGPKDFLENYLAGSLLALLLWWLDNDMPYSPAEMASMFQTISPLTHPGLFLRQPDGDGAGAHAPAKKGAKPSSAGKEKKQKETGKTGGGPAGEPRQND